MVDDVHDVDVVVDADVDNCMLWLDAGGGSLGLSECVVAVQCWWWWCWYLCGERNDDAVNADDIGWAEKRRITRRRAEWD